MHRAFLFSVSGVSVERPKDLYLNERTPHGNVPNLSADTRHMIYFRVNHKDHTQNGGGGTGKTLTDMFSEWPEIWDALAKTGEGSSSGGSSMAAYL